jgi:hypothetical protein
VRVLAVAQVLQLDEAAVALRRKLAARAVPGFSFRQRGQVVADRGIVVADPIECRHRKGKACGIAQSAITLQLLQHGGVLGWVGEHGHALPVLRRRAQHRRPADVDVLHRVVQRAVGVGDGGLERIEIDRDEVDGRDARLVDRRHVLARVAPREQAAVDRRVQGLDAAFQHLGKARMRRDLGDAHAFLFQQLGGAAGREDLHAERGKRAAQLHHA